MAGAKSETKIFAPKNGWLEDEVRFGMAHFQGSFVVSFRECNFWGVPNECFGCFATGKKDHQIQKLRNHSWARSKRQNATYKLDVRSNGKLRCTNLKSNLGACKWWFSRGISSSSVFFLVTYLTCFLIGNRPIEDSIRRFTPKTHEMGPRVVRCLNIVQWDFKEEIIPWNWCQMGRDWMLDGESDVVYFGSKWISVLPMCMTLTKVVASNMPKMGEDDPIWLICFKWVEATNYSKYMYKGMYR